MPTTTVTVETDEDITFSDGEGLTFGDLNGVMQESKRWLLQDYWYPRLFDSPGAPAFRTLGAGLTIVDNGGADMVVKVGPGMCGQVLSLTDIRPDYNILPFALGTSQSFTVDAGAAFIRWDIITAKIEKVAKAGVARDFKDAITGALSTITPSKTRQYRLSLTYTPGTVASTEPAVPAGEFKIARIEVPISAATINNTMIRDFRDPMGTVLHDVPLAAMHGDAAWLMSSVNYYWSTTTANESFRVPLMPPQVAIIGSTRPMMRVRSVALEYNIASVNDVASLLRLTDGAPTNVEAVQSQLALDGVNHVTRIIPTEPVWIDGNKNAVTDDNSRLYLSIFTQGAGPSRIVRGCWLELSGQ